MDFNLAVIVLVPVIAVLGFLFLAQTILVAWQIPAKRKGSFHGDLFKSFNSNHPLPHGDCYDHCMSESHWETARISACASSCGM